MVSSHRSRADRAAKEALTIDCFSRDRFTDEVTAGGPAAVAVRTGPNVFEQDYENFGADLIGAERDQFYLPPAPLAWPLSVPAWSIADLK